MYWTYRIRPGEDERNVYAEAVEYGIACKAQDLSAIVERLDKYIKKAKVRGAGLQKHFGHTHLWGHGQWRSWYEWSMGCSWTNEGRLDNKQGRLWYFELMPNRHYHIGRDETAKEAYAFPERTDLMYYFILIKFAWFYEEDGEKVYMDRDDARNERETFFQGLLDCIGFPLETLYVYDKEEDRIFR